MQCVRSDRHPQVEHACATWNLTRDDLRMDVCEGSAAVDVEVSALEEAASAWNGITFCKFRSMFRVQFYKDGTRLNRYYKTIDLAVRLPPSAASMLASQAAFVALASPCIVDLLWLSAFRPPGHHR